MVLEFRLGGVGGGRLMACASWLLNLDFAGGGVVAPKPQNYPRYEEAEPNWRKKWKGSLTNWNGMLLCLIRF